MPRMTKDGGEQQNGRNVHEKCRHHVRHEIFLSSNMGHIDIEGWGCCIQF
jgi:hypothetical protein